MTQSEFEQKLNIVNPLVRVMGTFENERTKILVECVECGRQWEAAPRHLLSGTRCYDCAHKTIGINQRMLQDEFKQRLRVVHPEITLIQSNDNQYVTCRTPLMFQCDKGHVFSRLPTNILQKKSVCPICKESSGERRIRRFLESHNISFVAQKSFSECFDIRVLPFDFYIADCNTIIEYDGKQHYEPADCFGGEEALNYTQNHDALKTQFCLNSGIRLIRIPYWDFDNIELILTNVFNIQETA